MKEIISFDKCTGCGACQNICPQDCIEMREGNDGFNYPTIDQYRCIDCNNCKIVCPSLKDRNILKNKSLKKTYAAYSKSDTIRENSTSGGVFTELAKVILKRGGYVVGAAFDENKNIGHIIVYNEEELN